MSNNFAVHDACLGCSGGPSPGVKAYAAYAEDAWPYQTSMGIYNCRYIGGTRTYSKHACGDAYDQGIPTESNGQPIPPLGDPVVNALAANGVALGISQVIYNRKIYDRRSPNGRTYRGKHPHYNHLHISFTHGAGQNLTYAYIASVLGDPEGEDMSLLGFDIGKMGDPSVKGLKSSALQAMLVERGYNLGTFGPNNDGVDGSAGDTTRKVLHDWKIASGITPDTSAGEGKIGAYEYAQFHPNVTAGGDHPDQDHSSLATKSALSSHTGQKLSGPHN